MAKSESRGALIGGLKSYVARRLLIEGGAKSHEADSYLAQLTGASDRVVALIVAMLVEDSLRIVVGRQLKQNTPDLFADFGLLSAFDAKIRMAFALGIIDNSAREDLNTVREIRNAAAHGMFSFNFADTPVENVCLLLKAQKQTRVDTESSTISAMNTKGGLRYTMAGLYYFVAVDDPANYPVTPSSFAWP